MILKTSRSLLFAALGAALSVALAAGPARAVVVSANIGLGPPNGGPNGSFSGTMGLGPGSQLVLGSNAISGNYKQHVVFVNTNFGFSAQNQTSTLRQARPPSRRPTAAATRTSRSTMSHPVRRRTSTRLCALLSDSASAPIQINGSSINLSISGIITLGLTTQFNGTLSNVTFTATGPASVSGGVANMPGNYGVTLAGSVTGNLSVVGNIGTLATIPPTVLTFPGILPANVVTSDLGVPNPVGFETTASPNNMLADFNASLSGLSISFPFSTSLNTSENFSVGSGSSGVTSIKIQNTTLNANVVLSSLSYNLSGIAPSVLVPEPSTLALGSLALLGLVGFAARRRKVG